MVKVGRLVHGLRRVGYEAGIEAVDEGSEVRGRKIGLLRPRCGL